MSDHNIASFPVGGEITLRRALLTGGAAILATAAVPITASAASNPDADLIRLCDEYQAALIDYDTHGGQLDYDVDPRWQAVIAAEDRLNGIQAQTMPGVLAKAKIALYRATPPGGLADFGDDYECDWAGQVVVDLLRLQGGAA